MSSPLNGELTRHEVTDTPVHVAIVPVGLAQFAIRIYYCGGDGSQRRPMVNAAPGSPGILVPRCFVDLVSPGETTFDIVSLALDRT